MKGLIVSCQVVPEDPIYTDDMVVKMAEAAQWAGAVGIRANSPEQIRAIKKAVDLPLIGLYKIRRRSFYHTDTGGRKAGLGSGSRDHCHGLYGPNDKRRPPCMGTCSGCEKGNP